MTIDTMKLGRLPAPDPRDRAFRFASLLPTTPTRTHRYYWSGFFGNQGNESSCVGFSWMHWLVSGPTTQPTRNWSSYAHSVYLDAQKMDEWEGEAYEGSSVRAGAKVLQAAGLITDYRWAWTGDEVVRAVLDIGPVVIGTNWYSTMFFPNSRGFISPSGGWIEGGHAYLVEGVNLNRGVVRIKNSWGRIWGKLGRAFMTIEDLNRLISEDGEAALATEVRAA